MQAPGEREAPRRKFAAHPTVSGTPAALLPLLCTLASHQSLNTACSGTFATISVVSRTLAASSPISATTVHLRVPSVAQHGMQWHFRHYFRGFTYSSRFQSHFCHYRALTRPISRSTRHAVALLPLFPRFHALSLLPVAFLLLPCTYVSHQPLNTTCSGTFATISAVSRSLAASNRISATIGHSSLPPAAQHGMEFSSGPSLPLVK